MSLDWNVEKVENYEEILANAVVFDVVDGEGGVTRVDLLEDEA